MKLKTRIEKLEEVRPDQLTEPLEIIRVIVSPDPTEEDYVVRRNVVYAKSK